MRVLLLSVLLLSSCATPPKPPPRKEPIKETCIQVAEQLGKGGLPEEEKRALVERLGDRPFRWNLRVMSSAEQTSSLDFDRVIYLDVECADWPRGTDDGLRYLFTLNFDASQKAAAGKLVKNTLIKAEGFLSKYEGQNAFAAVGAILLAQ